MMASTAAARIMRRDRPAAGQSPSADRQQRSDADVTDPEQGRVDPAVHQKEAFHREPLRRIEVGDVLHDGEVQRRRQKDGQQARHAMQQGVVKRTPGPGAHPAMTTTQEDRLPHAPATWR